MAQPEDQLSDFAARLSGLAQQMLASSARDETPPMFVAPGVPPVAVARMLLAQRHGRKTFLPRALFHEPAWEILLSLYIASVEGDVLSVKHVVTLVDAPVTTSQRWIDQLVQMKLLTRTVDPVDRRRLEISLTEDAVEAISRYLATLLPPPQGADDD